MPAQTAFAAEVIAAKTGLNFVPAGYLGIKRTYKDRLELTWGARHIDL
jgi:hypothetical protein